MLRFRNDFLLFDRFVHENAQFSFILGVEVSIILRNIDVDFSSRLHSCRAEFLSFIVAFRTPGDIVGVAECVNVEDVDVGGGQQKVLDEL